MTKHAPTTGRIQDLMHALPTRPDSGVRGWLVGHELELRLSLRMTVAGLLTFALCAVLGVSQSYWAVLTVVIVMQSSVGASFKTSMERMIATLGGAAWAIVVSILLGRGGSLPEIVALVAVLAPLSMVAAVQPAYRAAPITAIIVLLGSVGQHGSTLHAGLERVLDITIGCVVAFGVSLFVLPSRAHRQLAHTTAGALDLMAGAMALIADGAAAAVPQDRIRGAVGRVVAVADEAKRERKNHLTDDPDPDPLVRMLRRLRHDTEMIARASIQPLPEPVSTRLAEPGERASRAVGAFLHASAEALAGRAPSPSLDDIEAALAEHATAVEQMRHDGLTLELSADDMGRVFGITFALRQLRSDLEDFACGARELSRPPD
jgi:uncharacterized membrane protein YccC